MASDPINLPDPFGSDPSPSPNGGEASQASPPDNSTDLPDPFAPDPFAVSPEDGSGDGASDPATNSSPSSVPPSVSGGGFAPQTGVWVDESDPQFLIQWSLQEEQNPQLAASSPYQEAPPGSKARVRIFQEIFDTTLAASRPVVPFSLRDAVDPYPYLQGSLVLLQQPSDPPVLLVKNLKFSGFQKAQVVLFPSTPDVSGLEGNADSGG